MLKNTDWVGYHHLVEFINEHDLLSIPGDMVEIGTLFGGGARKLSEFLIDQESPKTLYVVDIFDLETDQTVTTQGESMASCYNEALQFNFQGKTQWEVFCLVTESCRNIVPLKQDSKKVTLPCDSLCFGFIDGNHQPDYVESDFYLVWNLLHPGGGMAFHDYDFDLPEVTKTIDMLVARHQDEIRISNPGPNNLFFLIRD